MIELFSIDKDFSEDEKRIFFSAAFSFLIFSLVAAHLYTKNLLFDVFRDKKASSLAVKDKENEKLYHVLLEQIERDKKKDKEIKALSDEDSTGSGGITKEKGFHTLTPFREFIFGGETIFGQKKETPEVQKEEESFVVEIEKEFQEDKDGITAGKKKKEKQKEVKEANRGNEGNKENTPEKTGPVTKIPTNYRFKQDFRFRWNGARITRIPTKKLNSYKYFKNMLRKIEDKFAPPGGGNFAYRDMAGIVAGQGIIPGEVGVVFLLDENGKVIDVKKTGSHSQSIVENACIDAIQGQDFGPVPDDIKEQGLIFGINFIFPGVMRY